MLVEYNIDISKQTVDNLVIKHNFQINIINQFKSFFIFYNIFNNIVCFVKY